MDNKKAAQSNKLSEDKKTGKKSWGRMDKQILRENKKTAIMEKNLGFWQMVKENKKTEKKPGVGQEEKKKKEKNFFPYSLA